MNYLFVISSLVPEGPVNALLSIVRGFQQMGGDQITILTLRHPEQDQLHQQFSDAGARIINQPTNNALTLIRAINRLRHMLITEHIDAVASTCIRADMILGIASMLAGYKNSYSTVQNIPSEDLYYLYPGWRGKLFARVHYTILRKYKNNIISVSDAVGTDLRKRTGNWSTKIYNPVDIPLRRTSFQRKRQIIYAASLSKRKNSAEAIAFVVGSNIFGEYEYLVFGKGPLEADLKNQYAGHTQVRWCGFTQNLAEVLAESRAYISASISEGLPLIAQMALISGCPCVLSDIPQHLEIASHSAHVFLYKSGDQVDFTRALGAALNDDLIRCQLDGEKYAEQVSPARIATILRNHFQTKVKE